MIDMHPWPNLSKTLCFLVINLLVLTALTPRAAAFDPTLRTLYSFCSVSGCADGATPLAGSLVSRGGSYYGATENGGATNHGVVYVLTLEPRAAAFTETALYSFCPAAGCSDGANPISDLIVAKDGAIFGIAGAGGAHNDGVVFELVPNADKTAYTQSVLYSFCSLPACTDGSLPAAGLIMDANGNLFGTTELGGIGSGRGGVVFELTPNADKTAYTQSVLHSFCSLGGCADGANPASGLIIDAQGNLFGTTTAGGANAGGVVFRLTPNANAHTYSEQVLYNFCGTGGSTCTDGKTPPGGRLLMDKRGDIFGTTYYGGANNGGVIFELIPNADQTAYTETVLYRFCSDTACPDGENPFAGVVMDKKGDLYGTTEFGGASNQGTVYALIHNRREGVYREAVLYSFCSLGGCADGSVPLAGLLLAKHRTLVGTTRFGGGANEGTVFQLGR